MKDLLEIMARLRDPDDGCPWDREQTFSTISRYTIEEAYEVADAIDRGNMDDLLDEVGDLLFQVVFYAQMASEEGFFGFDDVVRGISGKMIRRHPHVFGHTSVSNADEQTLAWERHKAEERKGKKRQVQDEGTLAGVALALPALSRAEKLQKRAAKVGFDWPDIRGVFDKVREELSEVAQEIGEGVARDRITEEIGDLLFACVNLARHAGVDAESALRGANGKFERRFQTLEARLRELGKRPEEASLDEMDVIWEQIKHRA